MKEFICIGKIIGTHGIKGEIKILSDSDIKNQVLKVGNNLYFGKEKQKVLITSYRHHKIYDMVCLDSYNNINQVLDFKNKQVYVKRNEHNIDYVIDDLLGYKVFEDDKNLGYIEDIIFNGKYYLFKVEKIYIPNVDKYIINIDLENQAIYVKNSKELKI